MRLSLILALLVALAVPALARTSPSLDPYPVGVLTVGQFDIGAVVTGEVRNGTWRLVIDGRDVTGQLRRFGNRVYWRPSYDLSNGVHRGYVAVQGRDGEWAERQWEFTVSAGSGGGGGGGGGITPLPPAGGGTRHDVQVSPGPGSSIGERPTIRATFPVDVRGGTARIWVDGRDMTNTPEAGLLNRTLQWRATYDLDWGEHTASVEVLGTDGQWYRRSWNFYVQ